MAYTYEDYKKIYESKKGSVEQALDLILCQLLGFIQPDGRACSNRVTAHNAQHKRGGSRSAHTEQRPHDPLQCLPKVTGHTKLHHQRG